MADTIYAPDPWAALSAQHSDIRREASVERGELRYDIASKASDVRNSVVGALSDVRREQAEGFGSTKYSVAVGNDALNREILTSAHDTADKVDEAADKIQQRAADFYIASQARDFDNARDLSSLKAQSDLSSQKLAADILLAGERSAAAAALEASRTASALALGHAQLSKEIAESKYEISRQVADEGGATRDLINSLKNDELNRMLIERNTDINHFRFGYWDALGAGNNSQFAAVNSQLNAFQSQLAETRQGMVNFGTMAGVGQSSTNNQVR